MFKNHFQDTGHQAKWMMTTEKLKGSLAAYPSGMCYGLDGSMSDGKTLTGSDVSKWC